MRKLARNAIVATAALCLAGALVTPAWTQQGAQEEEKFESRMIWGMLIQFAISKLSSSAFDIFIKWVTPQLTGGTEGFADRILANLMRDSGAQITPRGAAAQPAGGKEPAAPQIVVGSPDQPLRVEAGASNYQGAHIALMMAEDGGKSFVFRPVNQGFKTGERFKLRVVSTFGGELTIENINPGGERRQIYPPRPDQVVTLRSAKETLLPLGPDQYFEFTKDTGREQLVFNLADPRAAGAAVSPSKVFRQDTRFGSNFLQEVTGATYPVLQQSIELVHAAPR
jgi:hypothetical protein